MATTAKTRPVQTLDKHVKSRIDEVLLNQRISNQYELRYQKGNGYVIRFKNWVAAPHHENKLHATLTKALERVLNGERITINF